MQYKQDSTGEEQLRRATIGAPEMINSSLSLLEYDPLWPALYRTEAHRVRAALGALVLRLEHVGSTAIPGLAAKSIIDLLFVVSDSSDEESYVPAIKSAGCVLRVRETGLARTSVVQGPAHQNQPALLFR